jgi:hypothetical protein
LKEIYFSLVAQAELCSLLKKVSPTITLKKRLIFSQLAQLALSSCVFSLSGILEAFVSAQKVTGCFSIKSYC